MGRSSNRPGESGPPWQPFALIVIGTVIFVVVRKIRRTVAPLEEMMDAAGRVAEGDYSFRVSPAGPPDVQRVVSAFNTMTERLASNDEQRKHLLSDIAHELRTPLAVVQGTIEGMIDDITRGRAHLAPLLDQTSIARLLNDLQTVATAEAGALTLHRSDTDIGELIEDVVASFPPMTSERGISLKAEAGRGDGGRCRPRANSPGAGQPGVQRDSLHPGRRIDHAGAGTDAATPSRSPCAIPGAGCVRRTRRGCSSAS